MIKGVSAGIFAGFLTFIAIIIALIMITTSNQRRSSSTLLDTSAIPTQFPNCASAETIMHAAGTILNASWLPTSSDIKITITAVNGILCEDPERMANIMIVASPSPYTTFYFTRQHIHFLADGTPTSPMSLSAKNWTPTKYADDWKADWCDFMRSTYPKEYPLWGCPENTNQ